MDMMLRLTDEEHDDLRKRAANDGVSTQELVRRAVRQYLGRADHRDRVAASAERITDAHVDAIERLGR